MCSREIENNFLNKEHCTLGYNRSFPVMLNFVSTRNEKVFQIPTCVFQSEIPPCFRCSIAVVPHWIALNPQNAEHFPAQRSILCDLAFSLLKQITLWTRRERYGSSLCGSLSDLLVFPPPWFENDLVNGENRKKRDERAVFWSDVT